MLAVAARLSVMSDVMSDATAIDPVCGMEVETEGAPLTSQYGGVTHYFCGRGCKLEFDEHPERYLDPGYQPSM